MFALFRVLARTRCLRCGLGELVSLRCVLVGTSEETRESKELIGVTAPSDPVGSILVGILHSVEGGDVEQVCSNLETNLPCLRLLSLFLTCLYLACLYYFHLYILDIYLCLN